MNNMGIVPIWVLWLFAGWAIFVTVMIFLGRAAQKRTNSRLGNIDRDLKGVSKMEGALESMRDDVIIIKTILMPKPKVKNND